MPKGENSGGRMPPEQTGRAPQAPGVGAHAKRHDLETRSVPYLHGSDLQQGDVSRLQEAQSILGPRTQQSANPTAPSSAPRRSTVPQQAGVPDPIEFFAGRRNENATGIQLQGEFQMADWLPYAEKALNGATSSSMLRRLFIRQLRNVQTSNQHVVHFDQQQRDEALGEALGLE